jgi:hypothetical protein
MSHDVNQALIFDELVTKDEERQRELMRDVVRIVSRGNVSLQLGRYITEEDKQKMREQVFSYKIKAPI